MSAQVDDRQLAVEECRRRYGHENACITDSYEYGGHFFAGGEETEWVVYPEGYDPGVLWPKPGARCLCCHRLDGAEIAALESKP